VNHWPSRRKGAESEQFRKDVARVLSSLVNKTLDQRPTGLVLVMGDFNDELENDSIKNGLNWVSDLSELWTKPLGYMLSVDSEWSAQSTEKKGTFYFNKESVWNSIDHIFYGEGASLKKDTRKTYRYDVGSYGVVVPRVQFLGAKNNPQGCEILPEIGVFNGRKGPRCPDGASDHFGIKADLTWRE
jgi:endonuclease/exonuclease/phosphatase family metal-dependent hydrolase